MGFEKLQETKKTEEKNQENEENPEKLEENKKTQEPDTQKKGIFSWFLLEKMEFFGFFRKFRGEKEKKEENSCSTRGKNWNWGRYQGRGN